MTAGRPTIYSPKIVSIICANLSEGRSLAAMCREDENLPAKTTVYRWLFEHEEFRDLYTRARQDQADALADDMMDIADSATPEEANVARLRVDTRKWIASKMKPKRYGDSTLLKHGDNEGNPLPLSNILAGLDGRTSGLPGDKKPPE